MKKRFLERVQDKYLYKRLPENLVPAKVLKKSGKQARRTNQNSLPLRRPADLSLQFKRGAKGIHQRKLALKFSSSMQIDVLERGSLAPMLLSPQPCTDVKNLSSSLLDGESAASNPSSMGYGIVLQGQEDKVEKVSSPTTAPIRKPSASGAQLMATAQKKRELSESNEPSRSKAHALKQGGDAHTFGRRPRPPRGLGTSLFSSFQLQSGLSRQQAKRSSPLLSQLMERKKLRILYGNLSNREMNGLIRRSTRNRGGTNDNLFRLLESRLDVVLWRIGFFPTVPFARQWIYHGKVLVNNKVITVANYILQPGDAISISPSCHQFLKNQINNRLYGLFKARISVASKDFQERWINAEHKIKSEHHTPSPIEDGSVPIFDGSERLSTKHKEGLDGRTDENTLPWSPTSASLRKYGVETRMHRPLSTTHQSRGRVPLRGGEEGFSCAPANLEKMVGNPVATSGYRGSKKAFLATTWQMRQEQTRGSMTAANLSPIDNGQRRSRLRVFSLKLAHVEVSFRLFVAVYLFPPQRILFPAIVDMEKIRNNRPCGLFKA